MESSVKWRISKACEVCRTRKLRCNGEDPCERCQLRNLTCVYREKARNRPRKLRQHPPVSTASTAPSIASSEDVRHDPGAEGERPAGSPSIHGHSVAATHHASPSCVLQLYYGPSSNFSMLHSIYHQMEGTRLAPGSGEDAEEVGPGLDLFRNRRLFFGDLSGNRPRGMSGDSSALFLDHARSRKYVERYLATYWHVLPVPPKDELRRRLDRLWEPPSLFSFDSPENIILALAMAIGACSMDEESVAEVLFQKAKQGAAKLDELVNVACVQVAMMMAFYQTECARPTAGYLHTGTAVRKATAAGLHKSMTSGSSQSADETHQRQTTFWSLFSWETWMSLSCGRPCFISEPSPNIPVPDRDSLLYSYVALSHIMTTCASRIYKQDHESILPIWAAANDIRRDLLAFADQQRRDMGFDLVSDVKMGEKGVWQTIISTMYHHTLILTFRPFLVLRAKLKHTANTGPESIPQWLGTACEYGLEAARSSLSFLTRAVEHNELCRAIKYHAFFVEGACWVLSFDMLQDRISCDKSLPWVKVGLKTLETILHKHASYTGHQPPQILAVERMIQGAIRAFQLDVSETEVATKPPEDSNPYVPVSADVNPPSQAAPARGGPPTTEAPPPMLDNWNIDFEAMDMEAFLSIDMSQEFGFGV